MENDVGLLGLPHFAFLSWVHGPYKVFPLLLSINSCRVGLLGLFPLSFFLGSIQDPFLFFVEGILPWLTLPHYPWTNGFYSLFFMDILFLWAIARPCLFTFWALGVWPYCFAFILKSLLPFSWLGLSFSAVEPLCPYYKKWLSTQVIKQSMSKSLYEWYWLIYNIGNNLSCNFFEVLEFFGYLISRL